MIKFSSMSRTIDPNNRDAVSLADVRSHPGGMADNSPTLQRWVMPENVSSPEGTTEMTGTLSRPFGTSSSVGASPNAEALGYSQTSLRDRDNNRPVADVPSRSRIDPAADYEWPLDRGRRAFTLIELLIVIAIMAILAGLIFPVTGALNRRKMIARTKAELGLVKMAIDDYQTKLGHYPPDNPNYYFALSPLYFELMGTTNNGTEFVTLDGSAKIRRPTSGPDFRQAFGSGVQGFANCSATGGGEEARTAQRFLRSELKPSQVASFANFPNVKLLVSSIPGPYAVAGPFGTLNPANANPFRYNSSNPTNNPNSYDLWVDIVIAGKTNRINNWSSEPIIVATP